MKILAKLFLGILVFTLVVGLSIQLVPYGRDHTNPPVVMEPNWDSPTTRETFYRACGDCHSNQTVWPWYSNIAPISWMIQNHVEEGRAKFNVSEWNRSNNEGDEAAELVQSGKMPMPSYLPMHPEARLSAAEKQAFIQGLVATFGGELEGGESEGDD